MNYAIGFDIGGTKCAAVLGALTGAVPTVLGKHKFETANKTPWEVIELLCTHARTLCEENGIAVCDCVGVGISCGGPLDPVRGVILSPPNLPGWDEIPITETVQRELGIPAFLQNDADACALAEWKFGAGEAVPNMAFLTFGTGLGAGLILNGALYRGGSFTAGELGHIRLADYGPVGYGKAGSAEGFCSGGGIAQLAKMRAREVLQMGGVTAFCKSFEELEFVTAKSVADAADAGDALAEEIYAESGRALGRLLSILVDLLNLQVIVIGSIYARSRELIEPSMQSIMQAECLPSAYRTCRVVPAKLGESIGDLAALTIAFYGSKTV